MDHGVVIVEDTESHRALLREAGEYAAATGAELLLLAFLDEESRESDRETLESIARIEDVSHGSDAITEVEGIAERCSTD